MNAQMKSSVRLVVLAAVIALVLVPVAGAGIADGRSPDTKDAAATAQIMSSDLRSPDTRDAGLAAHTVTPAAAADLRSPDTRDAARIAHTTGSTVVVEAGSQGFDWTDAGIGAAGGFAIALIVGGMLLLTRPDSKGKLAL